MTLVVFDIDGTLTNTKAIDDLCFIGSVKDCWNFDLVDVDWSTYANVTDTGIAKDIFKDFFNKEVSKIELLKFKNLFSEKIISSANENPEAFQEVKGAKDFLQELEKQKIKTAIATGGWKITAEFKLRRIGVMLENFPYATSDDHHTRKEILIKAIEKAKKYYQTNFKQIIYIGDGVWDYKVSGELKIGFIGIDYLKSGKLKELGVKRIHNDYSDKRSVINSIQNVFNDSVGFNPKG